MEYSIGLTEYIKQIIELDQSNTNCSYSNYIKFNYVILES